MSNIINAFIADVYNCDTSNKKYEFLSDFAFLWGAFEHKLRKNNDTLTYSRIIDTITSKELNPIVDNQLAFESIPDFILTESSESDFLVSLHKVDFRVSLFPIYRKSELRWVTSYFGEGISIVEKNNSKIILLLCFIAYRLRNNLFHGNKIFAQLYQQDELFKIINGFLSEFLIKIKTIQIN